MRVILGAEPLLSPLTGIGHYTLQLARGLLNDPQVEELRFFALVVANVDRENELAVQRLRLAEKRASPLDDEHQRNYKRLIELVQQIRLP